MIGRLIGTMLLSMTLSTTWAQDERNDGSAIGEAMAEYFGNALKSELGLSDEQVEAILPLVREMERERARIRRERGAALRELRQAVRGGSDEARLQELLERAESYELRDLERRRELQARIDSHLGVRERIQFRFFSQRFRQRIQERISEIRGDRPAERPFGKGKRLRQRGR